jgi:hypothetical protein
VDQRNQLFSNGYLKNCHRKVYEQLNWFGVKVVHKWQKISPAANPMTAAFESLNNTCIELG